MYRLSVICVKVVICTSGGLFLFEKKKEKENCSYTCWKGNLPWICVWLIGALRTVITTSFSLSRRVHVLNPTGVGLTVLWGHRRFGGPTVWGLPFRLEEKERNSLGPSPVSRRPGPFTVHLSPVKSWSSTRKGRVVEEFCLVKGRKSQDRLGCRCLFICGDKRFRCL